MFVGDCVPVVGVQVPVPPAGPRGDHGPAQAQPSRQQRAGGGPGGGPGGRVPAVGGARVPPPRVCGPGAQEATVAPVCKEL